MATLKRIFWTIMWALSFKHFGSLPERVRNELVKGHCSCAVQSLHEQNGGDIVLLVEVIDPTKGLISDHFMNVDKVTGEYYDFYGNRVPPVNIGEITSFRKRDGHRYVLITQRKNWEEFGFEGLGHMLLLSKELNGYLYRTRG